MVNRLVPISQILMSLILLSGCASMIPAAINQPVNSTADVKEIQQGVSANVNLTLRWGGVIAKVVNKQEETWIEIVQKPLGSIARPINKDVSTGRFLAKIEGFLDPVIYEKGRELTVNGAYTGVTEGKIGEHAYKFPVIATTGYHLWPKRKLNIDRHTSLPISYWGPFYYHSPIYYRRGHH